MYVDYVHTLDTVLQVHLPTRAPYLHTPYNVQRVPLRCCAQVTSLVHASRTCTRVSALALAAIASSHSSHTHSRVEQPSRLSLPAPRIVSIHLVRVSTSSSASSAPSPCRSIESPDPLRATNTGARCDALAEHPSRSPSDQPASIYMYALHNRLSPGQRCTSESECAPNAKSSS